MIHQRHRQTDRQTTCDLKTALCTLVHRTVKMNKLNNAQVLRVVMWRTIIRAQPHISLLMRMKARQTTTLYTRGSATKKPKSWQIWVVSGRKLAYFLDIRIVLYYSMLFAESLCDEQPASIRSRVHMVRVRTLFYRVYGTVRYAASSTNRRASLTKDWLREVFSTQNGLTDGRMHSGRTRRNYSVCQVWRDMPDRASCCCCLVDRHLRVSV